MKLVTIGVYGADAGAFFGTLQRAGVDTFCDIRWRRGMRGSEYAHQALEGRLSYADLHLLRLYLRASGSA